MTSCSSLTQSKPLIFLSGLSPPTTPLSHSHNKLTFRWDLSGPHFINSGLLVVNMGRKKKTTLEGDGTCQICGTIAWKNAPMHFLFYEIHGETKAICSECGTAIVKVVDHMKTRWSWIHARHSNVHELQASSRMDCSKNLVIRIDSVFELQKVWQKE